MKNNQANQKASCSGRLGRQQLRRRALPTRPGKGSVRCPAVPWGPTGRGKKPDPTRSSIPHQWLNTSRKTQEQARLELPESLTTDKQGTVSPFPPPK